MINKSDGGQIIINSKTMINLESILFTPLKESIYGLLEHFLVLLCGI